MRGIVKDGLGKLVISELTRIAAVAAGTVVGTAKNITSVPLCAVAVLQPHAAMAASHTLDVTVLGSNDDGSTDPYVVVATFAQCTAASSAIQRVEITNPKRYYKTSTVAAGAFGSSEVLRAICTIVGTNKTNENLAQV